MPGGEHHFYFFPGVFDYVVHVYVDLFDAERVFVGLGYAFYAVAWKGVSLALECLGGCGLGKRKWHGDENGWMWGELWRKDRA